MHNYKELNVWIESKNFVITVYKVTTKFPKSEVYGLTSQINRAAISIPSNIAEGAGRNSNKDFSRFINIAIGSSFELETQLIIAFDLDLIDKSDFDTCIERIVKIQKMLSNFNKYLQSKVGT
jgi:four helix bundle protein